MGMIAKMFKPGLLAFAAALLLSTASCDQETAHPPAPAGAPPGDGWIKLGNVADSSGGCSVWKKKDDNGKTVYVAIGVNACSVAVADTPGQK